MKAIDNPQPISHSEARRLVGLFMAGASDNAQESSLYRYFSGGDVAPDLEQYRYMMIWFASGMPADDAGRSSRRLRFGRWQRLAAAVGAAAVVALVVTLMPRIGSPADDDYSTYAGSYVIRNGKRITDLDIIMPELKRAEQLVAQQQATVDREMQLYDAPAPEAAVGSLIDMDDPDIRAAYLSAMSD